MRQYLRFAAVLLLTTLTCANLKAQTVAPFKAGDRVVFLGNSITDGGHYHSYIWMYYMTRFPNMRFTCYNAGIGGDVVKQMNDRFETDVLPMNPTVLTLTWGMNDSGYFEWFRPDADAVFQKKMADSKAAYTTLEAKLKKLTNVRKIFLLGTPYDETTKSNPKNLWKGKEAAFLQLINFQEEAAKKNGYEYVDFHHPFLAINQREQAKDSLFSLAPNDRVHPDNDGHMVMAYYFLKAQGFAGKVVADVAINANTKAVAKSTNALIKNVTNTNGTIGFDYLANSLPYAVDTISRAWGNKKRQSDGLALIPFVKEFNQELLTVKGLKSGNYSLVIDGQAITTYTNEQLAAGVNLAEQTYTPQYQQSIQIRELNEERWEIERRLRNYAYVEYDLLKDKGLLYADNRAAMDTVTKAAKTNPFVNGNRDNYMKAQYKTVRDAWKKEMDVLIDQIYTINKPKNHRIELKPVQ